MIVKFKTLQTRLAGTLFALTLVACGGSSPTKDDGAAGGQVSITLADSIQLKEGRSIQVAPSVTNDKPNLHYHWQQTSGETLQLSSTSIKQITIQAPDIEQDSTAVLLLTVTDEFGNSVQASMQVKLLANQLPSVNVNTMSLQEKSQSVLAINAQDPDGTIIAIDWQQVSGPTLQFINSNTSELSVQVPAISQVEYATFRIAVTDDDHDAVVIMHELKLEPLWLDYHIGGHLAAKEMAGAVVFAMVNGQSFSTTVDDNSNYLLNIKLDDDNNNDLLVIKAMSTTKTGMELWTVIPSLHDKPIAAPSDLTPYSTAILALATKTRDGIVPNNLANLQAAERLISSNQAVEAAVLIAAFAEQHQVGLPQEHVSIFATVFDDESYTTYKNAMLTELPELLFELEEKLYAQGAGRVDINEQQLIHGLRLLSEYPAIGDETDEPRVGFYQFSTTNMAQVADEYTSYVANWGILSGALYLSTVFEPKSPIQLSITNTDLALSAAQLEALQQQGVSVLDAEITQLGEQLLRLSHGANRSLYRRLLQIEYQVQALMVAGELMEFFPLAVQTEEYVWGSTLYSPTLAITTEQLLGQWSLPVYRSNKVFDHSQFQLQQLLFANNGQGYSITTGDTFDWHLGNNVAGHSALTLNFANSFNMTLNLIERTSTGFSADIFVQDNDQQWLAAKAAQLTKLANG
jgi:hypothetical protein